MSKTNRGDKRKRSVNQDDYGTKCVCCDPRYDAAMAKLLKYNPDRHAYFNIPREPKEMKGQPRPAALEKRAHKPLKRHRFLKALPHNATVRANDSRYKDGSTYYLGPFMSMIIYSISVNKTIQVMLDW